MKIFIDWLKKAITKIEHDSELYVGNQFSNKFDVYFYNVGTDTDWFPTLIQLAPNGREAGPFTADSDSFTTTTIDNVTYLTATFTMGTGYAFIKGVSSFFLYENRITTPHQTKSVIGKFIVTLNNSDNGYFIDDPEFNPKVKEYVDKYSQLRFGGEASTSVIEALDSNQGVWLATDTGYYWYWDYDNNEYVRGNLFQAVSVADNGISTAKIQDGAVTENKLASAVKTRVNNSVQKGENNPTAASNVHTIIVNSNSQEEDTDESYGSHVDLSLDKATVGHSFSSNGTTKHSKIEFDEYQDTTDNEYYPRAVIETELWDTATPENSKITVLKDLIELLSGGKIELKKGDSYFRIYKNSSNKDVTQIYSKNNVEIDGLEWAHIGANSYQIDIIDGSGFYLTSLNDTLFLCNTTGFKSNVPFYYNNKELSTKEYADTKVPKSDIVDNLTSNDSTKPLSAAQGKILKGFIDSINTLLQCDDTTLDEIQEIVDYIKNNKSLIDGITTSKVSVSDIINNLTSTATNKPLSAAQGKILKDTLDSVQASISALTTNKQDKIDSSHKLDADLVSDTTSSNKFVSAYLKSLITTNRQDINLLDGRVTNLENNPTSNVSGTNDGTNWTSITIGNETYAIPSGSSSGGSGSGETLKIIEFNGMFVNSEVFQLGITKSKLDYFFNMLSQGMGITVNEDNIQTIWANSNDYEKMTAFHSLIYFALFMKYGMQTVCFVNATTTSVDNQTVVIALNLVMVDGNGVSTSTTNESDLSSSTISITTIGGGNGGSSASSGAYYEIKTNDIAFYDENGNQITNGVLDNLRITISEGQFEALKVKIGLPSSATINDLLTQINATFTETSASASNTAYQGLVALSGYCQFWFMENYVYHELAMLSAGLGLADLGSNNIYAWFTAVNDNEIPMGISATWTLTEYGTSGGSSSSESYYKIQIQDSGEVDNEAYTTILKLIVDKQDFNDLVDALNQQTGSNLSTPQDLIDAYDNMKGDSNYFYLLAIVFIDMATASLDRNYNALIWRADTFTREKIVKVGDDTGIYCGEIGGTLLNATPTLKGQISFSSSSTLTITEQTNQKI